jgi:hypothetical protein
MDGAECTIGIEIVLGIPDGTPRSRGSNGSSFGDRVNLNTR